jgi:NAD-dependent dihydropyrimidine dehydrogenase PreA subunit
MTEVASNVGSENKESKKALKKSKAVRLIVMIAVLVTSTVLGLMHQFIKGSTVVGVDALCPFGGIESAYTLITTGMNLQRIAASSFILLLGVLVVALIFRRSFCGLICPMGTIQELFARLGKKIFGRRLEIPAAIDRPARYLKYVVLALTVLFTIKAGELVIRPYDPWAAYHHLSSADLLTEFLIGFIVLAITLIGSLMYDRFFCKYACPMGAFLGIISKLSVFKIRRNESTCISCKACDKACPVNIKVSEQKVVDSAECIDCAECVNVCPSKDTLSVSTGSGLKMQPLKVLGAVVIIFAIVIGATTMVGSFEWTTKSLATEMKESGGFDPSQIKGRMTIHEVVDATGISGHAFREKFNLSEDDMGEQLKTLESKNGVSAEDVRAFVDEQLNK